MTLWFLPYSATAGAGLEPNGSLAERFDGVIGRLLAHFCASCHAQDASLVHGKRKNIDSSVGPSFFFRTWLRNQSIPTR
jgi:hypothetical protein